MHHAGHNDRAGRQQGADPEADGDLADVRNLAVQQRNIDQSDDDYGRANIDRHFSEGERKPGRLPDVIEILREADISRGDLERSADDELPDEQEGHQSSESLAPETFAQVK